jgi:hypothetical protein
LVVKLGVPGTQKALNDLLMEYGDEEMAEDYLNCGSNELYDGGVAWAEANGYYILTSFGSHRVSGGVLNKKKGHCDAEVFPLDLNCFYGIPLEDFQTIGLNFSRFP